MSSASARRRSARNRICAADSSAETYSVRRPAAVQVRQHHRRQRRLADARRAADQHERAGHDPAAEHAVELADAGAQALALGRGDVAQRHRSHDRAPARGFEPRPRAAGPRACAPPRPACSTRRSPGTGPPSAGSRARTPSRRGSRLVAAWRRSRGYAAGPTESDAGGRVLEAIVAAPTQQGAAVRRRRQSASRGAAVRRRRQIRRGAAVIAAGTAHRRPPPWEPRTRRGRTPPQSRRAASS